MSLEEKYGITKAESLICKILRVIRGTKKCPGVIYKKSRKKYGRKDNLSRYFIEKYSNRLIGRYTYGFEFLQDDHVKSIGAFTSIGEGQTVVPNDHRIDWVTTSPILSLKEFGFSTTDKIDEYCPESKKEIVIGNDVWIGYGSTLLTGVKIGKGSVIGAKSVVAKDIPPFSVYVGNKVIKKRFSPVVVEKIAYIDFKNISHKKGDTYEQFCMTQVTEDNIDEIIKAFIKD